MKKVILLVLLLPAITVGFLITLPVIFNITRTEIFFDVDYGESFKTAVKENHKPINFSDYFKIKFITTTSVNDSESIVYCLTEKYFLVLNPSMFKWNSYTYKYNSLSNQIETSFLDSQPCIVSPV